MELTSTSFQQHQLSTLVYLFSLHNFSQTADSDTTYRHSVCISLSLTRPLSRILTTTQTSTLSDSNLHYGYPRTPQHQTTDRTLQLFTPGPCYYVDYIHSTTTDQGIHTLTFEQLSQNFLFFLPLDTYVFSTDYQQHSQRAI